MLFAVGNRNMFRKILRKDKICESWLLFLLINVKAGPAPRGHFGAVPPQMTACDPKRKLCPEEINRPGATGVQIEA